MCGKGTDLRRLYRFGFDRLKTQKAIRAVTSLHLICQEI